MSILHTIKGLKLACRDYGIRRYLIRQQRWLIYAIYGCFSIIALSMYSSLSVHKKDSTALDLVVNDLLFSEEARYTLLKCMSALVEEPPRVPPKSDCRERTEYDVSLRASAMLCY